MIEHATEVIPLLYVMIVSVGGSLLGLIVWIFKRLQDKVDEIPGHVATKVDSIHAELLKKVDDIRDDQHDMARDLRAELTSLDRRVLKIELRCESTHNRHTESA